MKNHLRRIKDLNNKELKEIGIKKECNKTQRNCVQFVQSKDKVYILYIKCDI